MRQARWLTSLVIEVADGSNVAYLVGVGLVNPVNLIRSFTRAETGLPVPVCGTRATVA